LATAASHATKLREPSSPAFGGRSLLSSVGVGLTTTAVTTAAPDFLLVRALTSKDHVLLRETWLRALRESSTAFVSDYDIEATRTPRHWRRSLAKSTWVVAEDGDGVIGLARSFRAPEDRRARYIERVWVREDRRHQGVLRAMLTRLEDRARTEKADRLLLWVLHTNPDAEKAYDRLGFHPCEPKREQPVMTPRGPATEIQMWKPLHANAGPLPGLPVAQNVPVG
jgi:GNAT superfamily N-acetyltransferase